MNRRVRFLTQTLLFAALVLVLLPGCNTNNEIAFSTLSPNQGVSITNNMPILSWEKAECEKFVIHVDGIELGSIPGEQNWYIPFPLSFGNHEWQVVAVTQGEKKYSNISKFTVEDAPLSTLPEGAELLRENWKMISSTLIEQNGEKLSSGKVNTSEWKSSSVPATVLSVLVRNGIYPNPYFGTNNMRIPDCSDEFNEEYELIKYSHIEGQNPWDDPYWFRKEFSVPDDYSRKNIWLTLGEINYRAELWLNGSLIADTSEVVGMERQFRFDISSHVTIGKKNVLAIAIYPPDHPGKPAPAPLTPLADPGTNMADGMLSRDYTKWDVMGWDWQPAIRDRDMGITEDVWISATEDIEISNLYITSDLLLPDTTYADLTISLDLINHSDESKEGKISANISCNGNTIVIEQSITLQANETIQILWDKTNMPKLHVENPELWWPNGYGKASLYTLSLNAETVDGESSTHSSRFGIREVGTYIGANERVYTINGKEIYAKGGNWVIDMMLNWTAQRYKDEIELTKGANLNMLRVWGPTGAPPDVFYEAADEHGILIWQDFLNDYWGTLRNKEGYRPNISLFETATIEVVKKYRNHPSLVIWCGGNEGPNPREELIMEKILPMYDGRDSKHYLKISNGDGLHGGGPYHTLEPADYFTEKKLSGFSSEIGPSGVPVFESVQKFMPELGKTWMPGRFPLDGTWAYHDANDWPGRDTRKFSSYDNIIQSYYGKPDSSSILGAEDYLSKCQLVNYDVYRASLEAINSQLWKNSSGILLWKSNSSWPSMTWQAYDWFLQAHAGYYGLKKAAAPYVIQYNRERKNIK
jgi:hypothetical protein